MVYGSSINITHYKPHLLLEKYIRKISIFESKDEINYRQKLTPSSFTYLSYNQEDIPATIYGEKKVKPINRLVIAGPKYNEDVFVEYNGRLKQILFEFSASGFYYLFHSSPSKLVNKLTKLSDFIPEEIFSSLENELSNPATTEKCINILEEFLKEKTYIAQPFVDYIEKALQCIEEQHGHVNVINLAEEVGIGKRQFNRKFQEVVGLPPKTYSKIIQLHYIIKLMHAKKYTSMQDLSYQTEFYDHSHFTNRFKELTGFSPNEFIKSNKHIALKYFTGLPK